MTLQLPDSTGYTVADQVIMDIINRFELTFPGWVVGYYVEGSYAGQTAVATSALDLTVVFAERFVHPAEQEKVEQVRADAIQQSRLELDLTVTEEVKLHRAADPTFKLGTRLVHRSTLPNRLEYRIPPTATEQAELSTILHETLPAGSWRCGNWRTRRLTTARCATPLYRCSAPLDLSTNPSRVTSCETSFCGRNPS